MTLALSHLSRRHFPSKNSDFFCVSNCLMSREETEVNESFCASVSALLVEKNGTKPVER